MHHDLDLRLFTTCIPLRATCTRVFYMEGIESIHGLGYCTGNCWVIAFLISITRPSSESAAQSRGVFPMCFGTRVASNSEHTPSAHCMETTGSSPLALCSAAIPTHAAQPATTTASARGNQPATCADPLPEIPKCPQPRALLKERPTTAEHTHDTPRRISATIKDRRGHTSGLTHSHQR